MMAIGQGTTSKKIIKKIIQKIIQQKQGTTSKKIIQARVLKASWYLYYIKKGNSRKHCYTDTTEIISDGTTGQKIKKAVGPLYGYIISPKICKPFRMKPFQE